MVLHPLVAHGSFQQMLALGYLLMVGLLPWLLHATAEFISFLQGHLFRAAFLRHVPLFIRNLSENVLLCLAAAAVESTAKTMLAHMELRWRHRLTSRMHSPYFENMVSLSMSYTSQTTAQLHEHATTMMLNLSQVQSLLEHRGSLHL